MKRNQKFAQTMTKKKLFSSYQRNDHLSFIYNLLKWHIWIRALNRDAKIDLWILFNFFSFSIKNGYRARVVVASLPFFYVTHETIIWMKNWIKYFVVHSIFSSFVHFVCVYVQYQMCTRAHCIDFEQKATLPVEI